MHDYPRIVSETLQPREVRDVEELRALAHPMRQRILHHLRRTGPATSTTLGRDLGENSGIMSYHLRLLAEHDFVREIAGRGQGRERWWEVSSRPVWIPREGLGIEAQAEVSGLRRPILAEELEGFQRFRGAREAMGKWGRGTWAVQRARLTLTREEAGQFVADQQELIGRYGREAAGPRPALVPWCSASWLIPSQARAKPPTAQTSPSAKAADRRYRSANKLVRHPSLVSRGSARRKKSPIGAKAS